MELWGRQLERAELSQRIGRLDQVGGVRLVTLGDGPGRGVRTLEFRTGSGLCFEVLVDRGFDIGRCEFRGMPLAWVSPVGVEGPWYREAAGFGFLRSFGGGLVTTTGLDHVMFPEEDSAQHFHYPAKPTESHPLHGRVWGEPGRLVGYGEAWREGTCVLWAEAEVEQVAVFGENLALRRRVETQLGSRILRIDDEVVNRGHTTVPHMLLYHVNLGYPLLDQTSRLLAAVRAARARSDSAETEFDAFAPPQAGWQEQVYELDLEPGADGRASIALVNDDLGLGLSERYELRRLPHLLLWRQFGEGTYVLGLEPSTNSTEGRVAARERGALIELEPGETRTYWLEVEVLDGATAVAEFEAALPRASGEAGDAR